MKFFFFYHPREKFAQTFAVSFLMPASKVRAIIEKEFRGRRLTFDQVLYLKRYFGVSFAAMLRKVREMGFVSAAQFEDYIKRDPDSREREVFGASGGERASAARPVFSDRYKLLQLEADRKRWGTTSKPIPGLKAGALGHKDDWPPLRSGCHSSPGLKAWGFLASI